jgi:hypothetical protein
MLQIIWTDRITNGEIFQRAKEERVLLKILKIEVTHRQGIQLGIASL